MKNSSKVNFMRIFQNVSNLYKHINEKSIDLNIRIGNNLLNAHRIILQMHSG